MEKIDKIIDILQAFNERKPIQWKDNYNSNWHDYVGFEDNLLEVLYKFEWRIKPQPTYRPYANTEEFLKASKEHGPYLYRNWSEGQLYIPTAVFNKEPFRIRVHGNTLTADSVYREFTWQDGTPCGILEQ